MVMSVILAAGKGTRMVSDLPKVLHPLLGAPLLEHAIDRVEALGCSPRVVVVGHKRELVEQAFEGRGLIWAHQAEQRGTGHAAHTGVEAASDVEGEESVLILNGDLPLLGRQTLEALLERHSKDGADVTILTCIKEDPRGYGRIERKGGAGGPLVGIVEEKDASESVRAIREINVGVYVVKVGVFRECYARTTCDNAQGEYYLTDVVVEASRAGLRVATHTTEDEAEISQVNSRRELAHVSQLAREAMLGEYMDAGVTIEDPHSTFIEKGVQIGRDVHILPFTYISRDVVIEDGCRIGPFARLRPGTVLRRGVSIGNFVEIKNSDVGPGTKAQHLSYVGDTTVGSGANIGAGTIVANYDGKQKHRTRVGDGAFIGSGTILVAPVDVGAGATTGAGSVVTRGRDVAAGETVVGVPARPLRRRKS